MPFKSQAQRRKFAELLVKGEISKETYEEWNRETGSRKLPERLGSNKARTMVKSSKAEATPARKASGAKGKARKR